MTSFSVEIFAEKAHFIRSSNVILQENI